MSGATQFRKKPVVVQARHLTGEAGIVEAATWIKAKGRRATCLFENTALEIVTLEGTMRAEIGDWVIRGVAGEFYPCKPDIFEQTYEAVP